MKQELENQLALKALEYLKSAEAFAKAEIPSYLKEILQYEIYSSAVGIVFSLLVLGVSAWVFKKSSSDGKREGIWEDRDRYFPLRMLALIGSLMALMALMCETPSLIKALVAPRVYLL